MADLTMTTLEQTQLHAAAPDLVGDILPTPSPLTWSTSDPTICKLSNVGGDPNSIWVIAGNAGTATITATNGTLTETYVIDIVSPLPTGITITNDVPTAQNDLNRERGRGLGLGYLN